MSSSGAVLPKITTLAYDPGQGSCYVALPSCIRRQQADAFRTWSSIDFEFHKNSGSWIVQQGFNAIRGITTKSVIIIIASQALEEFKSLFYLWLGRLLEKTRTRTTAKAPARHHALLPKPSTEVAPATHRAAL
ncbi:MAG: hypothetical protein AAB520_03880 [Patescibacteria group bacterium]